MLDKLRRRVIIRQIIEFLGEAPAALRDHLNTAELVRIALTAFFGGGGVWGALEALASSLPQWVAPPDVALMTGAFIVLFEVARRLGHGAKPPTLDVR